MRRSDHRSHGMRECAPWVILRTFHTAAPARSAAAFTCTFQLATPHHFWGYPTGTQFFNLECVHAGGRTVCCIRELLHSQIAMDVDLFSFLFDILLCSPLLCSVALSAPGVLPLRKSSQFFLGSSSMGG
jgi:hypothetical protein